MRENEKGKNFQQGAGRLYSFPGDAKSRYRRQIQNFFYGDGQVMTQGPAAGGRGTGFNYYFACQTKGKDRRKGTGWRGWSIQCEEKSLSLSVSIS